MKKVSIVLVLLMIFNSFTSISFAIAESNEIYIQKTSEEIIQSFEEEEFVEVIVYLNKQYVLNEDKEISRIEVVNELKLNAMETQKDLISLIQQEKKKGNILEYTPYYIVNAIYVKAKESAIREIVLNKEVKKIYSNSLIEMDNTEIDTTFDSINTNVEWNIERIGANKVWDEFNIHGEGVVVGIIDSGVHWTHEAIKEKWRGYNPNDPENPTSEGNWFDAISDKDMPYDEVGHYHGTHVTGIILGDNGIGVAPGTKWIAARAFTKQGAYPNWLLEAGEWMLAPNGDPNLAPDIINNSWATTTTSKDGIDEWYRSMVQAWRAAGILPVFATGNDTSRTGAKVGSVGVPANYPESFAIGAVDNKNVLAKFSKRGPSQYGGDEIKPEVVAPGLTDAEIPAGPGQPLVPATGIKSSVPGGYQTMLGTSMAAPHVTGAVALLLSANKSLTVNELEDIIIKTATPLVDSTYTSTPNHGYGYGLVNAYDAVNSILDNNTNITVTGKVLGEVNEVKDLEIIHQPNIYIFDNKEMPIFARIKGEIAIKEANLFIKSSMEDEWQTIQMNRIEGSEINGIYEGIIGTNFTKNDQFIYRLSAEDYKGNLAETDEFIVTKSFGIRPDEYETDFTSKPIGWSLSGDWEWGETYDLPYIYGGQELIGTNLSGNYSRNKISILEMPPIDLRDTRFNNVALKFTHFREFDLFDDVASIKISVDNKETWKELESYTYQYNYYWIRFAYMEDMAIDLTKYIGSQNPVYIRFELDSKDDDVQMRGWYIDNISLIGTDIEAPKPATSLSTTVSPIGVGLSWVAPISEDIIKYNVYRSTDDNNNYNFIGDTVSRYYLDTEVEEGKNYHYRVASVDIFGNESIQSIREDSITIENIKDKIYYSDFEDNDGGFTKGGDNNHWEYGESRMAEPAEAFTGSKSWGTNLKGKYNPSNNSWIETPEISIPTGKKATLTFHHWLNIGVGEEVKVLVSEKVDGHWSDWISKVSYRTISTTKEWKEANIDLADYSGKDIKIRFILESSETEPYTTGWYIDDVLIYADNIIQEDNTLNGFSLIQNDCKFDNFREIEEVIVPNVEKDSILIPIDAEVSIIETGNNTRTSLIDGSYKLNLPSNKSDRTITLKVEAYGYYTIEEEIEVTSNVNITKDIVMKKIERGNINGKLIDSKTEEPIQTGVVRVVNDRNIESSKIDKYGDFQLKDLPYGKYILSIEVDGYDTKTLEVNINNTEINLNNIVLSKTDKTSYEIGYDDGTMERAVLGNSTASRIAGTAIRMKAPEYGKVLGASIYFQDASYPQPGGNRIGVAIFTTDENGNPVAMHKAPIFFQIKRGEWNYLDLSSLDFYTGGDFFIATIQDDISDFMPAVGVDDDTIISDNSYMHINGKFIDIGGRYGTGRPGTLMIRGYMEFTDKKEKYVLEIQDINLVEEEEIYRAVINVKNMIEEPLSCTIIIKPIDEKGRAYKPIYKTITFSNRYNMVEYQLDKLDYLKGVKDIKVYIWDSIDNMKPLANMK